MGHPNARLIAALVALLLLFVVPRLVLGAFFTAVFVLVMWRLMVPRGGLLRRMGGRR